jgi:hypothetical protein
LVGVDGDLERWEGGGYDSRVNPPTANLTKPTERVPDAVRSVSSFRSPDLPGPEPAAPDVSAGGGCLFIVVFVAAVAYLFLTHAGWRAWAAFPFTVLALSSAYALWGERQSANRAILLAFINGILFFGAVALLILTHGGWIAWTVCLLGTLLVGVLAQVWADATRVRTIKVAMGSGNKLRYIEIDPKRASKEDYIDAVSGDLRVEPKSEPGPRP